MKVISGPATTTDPETLLPEEAAARLLGVSTRFLQKHRCEGDGPQFVVISRRCIRYRRRDLISWADARIKTTTAA